jgi:hypothetical protein
LLAGLAGCVSKNAAAAPLLFWFLSTTLPVDVPRFQSPVNKLA